MTGRTPTVRPEQVNASPRPSWWSQLPRDIATVGGLLPWRLSVLALALVLNVGFYLPDVPSPPGTMEVPGLDKVVHVGVFALTAWAAGRLLAPRRRFPMGWVVLVLIGHAILIELLQGALLPDRTADGADVLADLLGVGLGLAAWTIERRVRARP